MKPNFALSLSFQGIKLLYRAAGGWREVGEVGVTSDDLAAELGVLRRTAVSLEPGGLRAKLIIPAEQIKYLTIETPGLSDAARRKEAEAALREATPYEIADLAYDISQDGPLTHIAAVARDTLAEAEAFAQEHRFHPVSFVAIPDTAPFLGEPFFGMTDAAASLLEPGETVESDGIAVVIVGMLDTSTVTAAETGSEAPQPESAADENADETLRIDEPAAMAAEDASAQAAVKEDATTPHPTSKAASAELKEPAGGKAEAREKALSTRKAEPVDAAPVPAAPATAAAAKAGDQTPTKTAGASGPTVPAEPSEPRKPTITSARKVSAPSEAAGTTEKAPMVGFSSRRGAPVAAPARSLGGATRTAPPPDSSSLTAPAALADTPEPEPKPAKAGFLSRRKLRGAGAVPAQAGAAVATGSEQERMTVFGARSDQIGGKPRFLGLIMTVILLIFLAGVAAWAAVFLDDGLASLLRRGNDRAVASAPENQIDTEIIRVPTDAQEDTEQSGDPVQIAALDPVLSAEDGAVLDALQDPRPEPQRPVITEAEAAARYAVTGIWPLAPETALDQPDVADDAAYRSGLDPVSTASDAIALPSVGGLDTDVQLAAVASPAPFGQQTARDSRGLMIPQPEGVVTPEGYTLYAASPPRKPPATLTRFARQPVAEPAVSPLAAFRPSPRPSGLAENTQRAQLGGVTLSELAALRPALRPSSVQERVSDARAAEQAAIQAAVEAENNRSTAAAAAAAAAALALPEPSTPTVDIGTKYAVAQSRRPDTRPRNFARIVKRAERAAPVATRVATTATVAPRSVAPSIPSKASVARSATVKNAINLRKVNLIGVYGKPSSRRALVRLSNGRYQKVRVGDRIDGGRVSAISDTELRYTKGSRNVVLKIPSS